MRSSRSHRRLLTVTLTALLVGAPLALEAKPHAKHAARDEVMALEKQWVKAQIQSDVTAMDKLLSPDFLGITAYGQVVTKTQQLDRMKSRTIVIHSLEISDVRVKLLGQRGASVTSLAQMDGVSDGRPLTGAFRYTHVYQRLSNGMWSITNFEATRIPGSGKALESLPTREDGVPPQKP